MANRGTDQNAYPFLWDKKRQSWGKIVHATHGSPFKIKILQLIINVIGMILVP